jgi:hypothetical protein
VQGFATATHSTDTLTAKFYIGGIAGTLIVSTGALDVANNDAFYIEGVLIVRTIGATGTVVATGTMTIGTPGTSTVKDFLLGSTVVNTTIDQHLTCSLTWSVADPGNSARVDVFNVSREAAAGNGLNQPLMICLDTLDNSGGGSNARCRLRRM